MQIAKSFLKTKKEQRKKCFAMIFRHSKGHGHKDRGTPIWTGRKTEQRISIMTHNRKNLCHDPRRGGPRLGKGMCYEEGAVGVTGNSDEDCGMRL